MLEELKGVVCQANLALVKNNLVVLTWGNVSAVDETGQYLVIKPSGVSYDVMVPDQMVVVALESGEVVEGNLRPSSDTPTHLVLYRQFKDIKAVTHTHSTFATVFAQAGLDIPPLGTTHADYFYGNVPCAPVLTAQQVEEDYEAYSGHCIIEEFGNRNLKPLEVPAILLQNHGVFSWGASVDKAVENAVVVEEVAKMAYYTKQLNSTVHDMPAYLQQKHYLRKHGKNAYYGQK